MNIDVGYYEEICKRFEKRCPMWAEAVDRYVPRHDHIVRAFLKNGDYVDYDDRTETFRYVTKDTDAKTDILSDDSCREIFSRNLLDMMRTRGIGQTSLAERSGLSQVMISKYITKRATPSLTNVRRMAQALNCGVYELIE